MCFTMDVVKPIAAYRIWSRYPYPLRKYTVFQKRDSNIQFTITTVRRILSENNILLTALIIIFPT